MRKISFLNSNKRYQGNLFLENLLIIYFSIGVFLVNDTINISRYIIGLCIQTYSLMIILRSSKRFKIGIHGYLNIVSIVGLIAVSFFIIGVPTMTTINRILPILSVFGIIILGENSINININRVIKIYVQIYTLFICLVNLDAVRFMLSKNAIWKPISYMGYRYTGPFGDPNFMALFSVVVLLLIFYSKDLGKKFSLFAIVVLLWNIILANSLSAYIFLFLTVIINKYFNDKNLFRKQIFFLVMYIVAITLYIVFKSQIEDFVTYVLYKLYDNNSFAAQIKYTSLAIRLDTQVEAITIAIKELLGQGPLQIVSQLGHDTHNSYVGFFFEQGALGVWLIVCTWSRKLKANKLVAPISTFLFLSGMLLNIHYTTIYSLALMLQYKKEDRFYLEGIGDEG